VVVIGPCAAGKTTLVSRLIEEGISAVSPAQEHTLIPDLYRHRGEGMVVYLDVSFEEAARRRDIDWGPERLQEQKDFMDSSRRAADVYILTDDLSPDEIAERVLRAVRNRSESPEA